MNILFLSAWYPLPTDNGSKIRVYNLLRHLDRHHTVVLVAFSFGTAAPEESDEIHRMCPEVHILQIDPIERLKRGALPTFLSKMPTASLTIPEMSALVKDVSHSHNFDVVIASTMTMSQYALEVNGIKIIEEHNSLSRWMRERLVAQSSPFQRVRCWVSWQKARRAEARLYQRFDLVTVTSEEDYQAIRTTSHLKDDNLAVVPNGVDCGAFRSYNAPPNPYHLVFNGSLNYSPNHEAMVWFVTEIFPLIRKQFPAVTLNITGSTNSVDSLALLKDPGVRLTGFVEDIQAEVTSATVCVVPIRQGGGTRLKILEAMALGTPIVTTSKGAEGLDVIPNRHLLVANDSATFATHVINIMANPGLREKLAVNARNLVQERYDWEDIGRSFVTLVEETFQRSKETGNGR